METTPTLARAWLEREFRRRRAKNPAYSLRAFSQQLKLPSGRLSEILARKRQLTPALGEQIADRLAFDPAERKKFLECIERERGAKRRHAPQLEDFEATTYHQLSMDSFQIIADWQHYAILSLMETRGFRSEPAWIGRRLGLAVPEVQGALERLERVGLVKRRRDAYVKTSEGLTTSRDISSAALRRAHKQNLAIAVEALDEVPVEERDVTAMTMAIDPDKLSLAKDMIREFRRKLCAALESGRQREVYHLNVQLIPISKTGKEKR